MMYKALVVSWILFLLSILIGTYLCAWGIDPRYAFSPMAILGSMCGVLMICEYLWGF